MKKYYEQKSRATLFLECKDKSNYLRGMFDGAEPEDYKQNLDWDDIAIDDLENSIEIKKLLDPLNRKYSDYHFEIGGSGYRPDLVIINKALKKKYDAMDKPYTWNDIAKATGMWTDAPLHSPYKFLTERQYREIVRMMKEIQKMSGKKN